MIKKLTYTSLLWMLLPFVGSAQTESDTLFHTVAKRLHEFQYNAPREKVYVHQDRTQYVAGETMWFKAYQSTDATNPIESGVLYVDLSDGLSHRVCESQWKLEEGTAHGSIVLPDTLSSGKYQLRAYTQWMRNYGTEEFFTREIEVVSKLSDLFQVDTDISLSGHTLTAILQFREIPQGELTYRLRINKVDSDPYPLPLDEKGEVLLEIELSEEVVLDGTPFFVLESPEGSQAFPISLSPAIQFTLFPEGGNLVAGIPSKVAFKVNDRQGRGLSATGVVIDEEGKEIRRFQTQHLGHGTFAFVAEKGKKYTAVLDEVGIRAELPEAMPVGLAMGVTHRNDRLRVTLRHNLDVSQTNTPLYLTVHQNGSTWFNARVDISSAMSVVDIPHDKLPKGVFVITLYDERYHAFAERLCMIGFPEQLPLEIKTDRMEYGRREKVTVELGAAESGLLNAGNFSVAVVKAHLDDIRGRDNYYSHFFLSHELRGKIENPYSYFTAPDSVAIPNMDLLLLTQGWRRYSWDQVMEKKYPEITHYVEQGLTFSGKVHLENEKQKIEDIEVTAVFRHDELNDIESFQPAEGGDFTFTNYDFVDTAEVIISAMYKRRALDVSAKELARAKPDYYNYGGLPDKEKQQDSANAVLSYEQSQGIDERIHELGEVSVVGKVKKLKSYNRYHVVLHDQAFVHTSYETKKTQSYAAFGAGGEGYLGALAILQHVPGVRVVNGVVRVTGTGAMKVVIEGRVVSGAVDPIYILDGNKSSYEEMKMMHPALIERVEVLDPAAAMIYDSAPWGGAIVFHTHSWEGMVYSTPTKTLTYKFAGYNQAKEFYSPDYSPGVQEYIEPDHRNTLYWQPNVTINADGKAEFSFFTSDDKGEYLIHCEGRSGEGEIGATHCLIGIH
ncbi:TonB-dependent receptor plug domain-containing protein [Parabacteroides sp. PF5-6]|uniref:TonB-dependent receptor plug domain-containing protein n=1 Tax=Parabacteroides sp. PF5-6 TaxID=1742403 RepID=UPI0024068691|nr:TonB-dependent receptor plug domain-containing protein [Parabacteroides sp. PF5-6]MDF9831108.1 hypothetical protein [Parabacteroides sp. PF5-6]